jgi:DNA-binding transcriptional MerR regulator
MSGKAGLLPIGEMSKYSGASIRSLRYYEQMKLIIPAFTDPDTGYRYYSVDQLHHIGIIMFCIELDIPLKELALMTGTDKAVNLRMILQRGKDLAQTKLNYLENGLRLFHTIEQQMALADQHPKGELYTRKINWKTFFVRPCDGSNMGQLEVTKAFMEMPYSDGSTPEGIPEGILEYGLLHEYSPAGVEHYVFVEIPRHIEMKNTKKIPAGLYHCCLDENGQIERARDIFAEPLGKAKSFLAIETEIMADKYELGKPFYSELRVIALG